MIIVNDTWVDDINWCDTPLWSVMMLSSDTLHVLWDVASVAVFSSRKSRRPCQVYLRREHIQREWELRLASDLQTQWSTRGGKGWSNCVCFWWSSNYSKRQSFCQEASSHSRRARSALSLWLMMETCCWLVYWVWLICWVPHTWEPSLLA